jgi:cation diffusion facilitator CzcD-associated flavoprotein CzcO
MPQVIDTNYYETFNRPNVKLVDLRKGKIERITKTGLSIAGQPHFVLDVLVFATGFDALTGPLLALNPTGRHGQTLKEKWAAGPKTYLGLQTAGFPNMFTV